MCWWADNMHAKACTQSTPPSHSCIMMHVAVALYKYPPDENISFSTLVPECCFYAIAGTSPPAASALATSRAAHPSVISRNCNTSAWAEAKNAKPFSRTVSIHSFSMCRAVSVSICDRRFDESSAPFLGVWVTHGSLACARMTSVHARMMSASTANRSLPEAMKIAKMTKICPH